MLRIDKYLANNAGLSRSEARVSIKDGIVTVNGEVVNSIGAKISETDTVFILNQEITVSGELYIVLHKPEGVICATDDEDHDTVLDIIPDFDDEDLNIAGRLDKDTTGIVLLSTDGQWVHRVTSPNYKHIKTYELETADPIATGLVEQFKDGILLKDSDKPTAPAVLEITGEKTATLGLIEGRYHQVKRMFGACGNKVIKLHRRSVGAIDLTDLAEGEYRELTAAEVSAFSAKA